MELELGKKELELEKVKNKLENLQVVVQNNKLFGNEKVIDELMNDFLSVSETNIPDIDIDDAYIALDILENINDGELYTGMLVALAMVAKRFRYECCEDEDYKSQYYAEQLIKEIEPKLTDVENVESLGVLKWNLIFNKQMIKK